MSQTGQKLNGTAEWVGRLSPEEDSEVKHRTFGVQEGVMGGLGGATAGTCRVTTITLPTCVADEHKRPPVSLVSYSRCGA